MRSWVCFKGQMSVRYDILFLARLVSDSPPCREEAGVLLSREVGCWRQSAVLDFAHQSLHS